jgi:alkyl hydroperoxide reductase subunit AhpC/glutaredoxin
MILPVGSTAPDFTLPSQNGKRFRLADWRGRKNVLIMFLPAAFTPICTTELPALAAMLGRFWNETDTLPIAITTDNSPSNLAWARQCNANGISVLSDFNPHGAVSRAYGVLADDGVAERSTVIIDKNGVVRHGVVAGRFGKRSVPELFALAARINGGQTVLNTGGLMPMLDLPVLYTTSSCPHCANVKSFLASSGLSQRIVVRDVDKDQVAMKDLMDRTRTNTKPNGIDDVPTLIMPDGRYISGDKGVIDTLSHAYGLQHPPQK